MRYQRSLKLSVIGGAILVALLLMPGRDSRAQAKFEGVPGVVIDHSPASSGLYIGSPGLAILPNGDYLASHDYFGPKSGEYERARTVVFRSTDRGRSWKQIARLEGLFGASLFAHGKAVYLLGTEKHYGRIVIRRSNDGGNTWTEARDSTTGLLVPEGEYVTAPVPVLFFGGRLWRGMEDTMGGTKSDTEGRIHKELSEQLKQLSPEEKPWFLESERFRAFMLSAPVDADLLRADSWTFSNRLGRSAGWLGGDFVGWTEGNAVPAPDGGIVSILRVWTLGYPERSAIIRIGEDGRSASFDPDKGFVDFPGGAKKFTIRYDSRSRLYWSLATVTAERHMKDGRPTTVRNTLALTCSPDLVHWTIRSVLLYHPDAAKHGFQYADWLFDQGDIIAACRTAYDDGLDGANNYHDANFLTFHRIVNFCQKTMADSVPIR
jgi:hypothetical protein